jgi:hypothetical protein
LSRVGLYNPFPVAKLRGSSGITSQSYIEKAIYYTTNCLLLVSFFLFRQFIPLCQKTKLQGSAAGFVPLLQDIASEQLRLNHRDQ